MGFTPFTDDVVDAITRHMNVDHVEDTLLICRNFGAPAATAARMTGFDNEGGDFEADTPAGITQLRIPWRAPISKRVDVRAEIVWLHEEATRRSDAEHS